MHQQVLLLGYEVFFVADRETVDVGGLGADWHGVISLRLGGYADSDGLLGVKDARHRGARGMMALRGHFYHANDVVALLSVFEELVGDRDDFGVFVWRELAAREAYRLLNCLDGHFEALQVNRWSWLWRGDLNH